MWSRSVAAQTGWLARQVGEAKITDQAPSLSSLKNST